MGEIILNGILVGHITLVLVVFDQESNVDYI